jgi:hypothetical protein
VLTNTKTKDVRETTTTPTGGYYFASVFPGTYTLKVSLSGFKTVEHKVTINPRDTLGLDVVLELGAVTEVITVTEEPEIVQTETGAREGLLTAKQIDDLSIIGRSSMELLRIMPGVVPPDQTALESVGFGSGSNSTSSYTVNGVRGTNNTVSLDGTNLIDIGSNSGVIISLNPDMVESVKIQTSNYAAEYGTSGVQVSAVTKGGGNEFHGTAYGYVRHYKLAANDRSNSITGVDRPKSEFWYPGGNLGGPIIKDKLFFFGAFEVQRQKVDSGSDFSVTATEGQRRGDFSEFLAGAGNNLNQPTEVYDPNSNRVPAPGNNLAPWIDPVGQALMNNYPLPNYVDPNNRYNYVFSKLQPTNRLETSLRLDYVISDRTKAYLRLAYSKEDAEQYRGVWWNQPGQLENPTPQLGTHNGKTAALHVVSVINPTMTNEVLLSWGKLELNNDFKDPSRMSLASNGIGDWQGWFGQQVPWMPLNLTSWREQGIGDMAFWGNPMFAHNDTYQLADNLTKVMDTHVMKFGISIEQVNKFQNFQNYEEGFFEFGNWWQPHSTGSVLGDLLVGRPVGVQQGTVAPNVRFRYWNFDGYIQDSWKVTPNLTLEGGLRISYMPNNYERNGLGAVFKPELYDQNESSFVGGDVERLNGVAYASTGEVPKGLVDNRPVFFMPRLNFAWDITGDGSTVLRGGAGVFYNRAQGNAEYDIMRIPPNSYRPYMSPWTTGADSLGGGSGLSFGTMAEVDPFSLLGAQGLSSINPDSIYHPRTTSMSLSLARRIPGDQVLEVGYVGTFGRHLMARRNINVIPPGTFLEGQIGNADLSNPTHRAALADSIVNAARPYPALAGITFVEYGATTNYHSLQATLSRQAGERLQYFATYTFSKALGTTNVNEQGDRVDPFDARNRSYGILSTDRTHMFNLSYNWNVPDLVSETSSGFLKQLLNGWQISGISTFTSGEPIRLTYDGDIDSANMAQAWAGTDAYYNQGNATGAVGMQFVGDPRVGGTELGDRVADLNAIGFPTFPDTGTFIQPYYIRGPNRNFHDVTLMKNFPIGEGGKKLQFRVGFFNIFNQAFGVPRGDDIDLRLDTLCNVQVAAPDGAGGTSNVCDPTQGFHFTDQTLSNFGKINLLRGHRIIELALKFHF